MGLFLFFQIKKQKLNFKSEIDLLIKKFKPSLKLLIVRKIVACIEDNKWW